MAFNINEFNAEVNKSGLAKNNLFEAIITGPVSIGNTSRLLCRSVSLPGVNIGTEDFRPHGYGPAIKRPMSFELEPVTCVFMVDGAFRIKNFLHRWAQLVFNYNNETMTANYQGVRAYEAGYMRDYAGSVTIKVYPQNDPSVHYEYRYGNAYPISIGGIDIAWENGSEIMTMTASFAYNIFNNSTITQ